MAELTTTFLIFLPIFLGILWIWSPQMLKKILPQISLFTFIAILIIIGAAYQANTALKFSLTWQPQSGVMRVIFERSSLLLIFLLSLAFFAAFLSRIRNTQALHPLQISLAFFSYSAAVTALAADHFLLRYAALEFTGLCVVGTMLASNHDAYPDWAKVKNIFLNFRLADLALLSAILLMYTQNDTFLIKESLESILRSSSIIRIVTASGLMIAVWVKMQIWPLNIWAAAADKISSYLRLWYVDILFPVLGAYLLYRTSPLLQTSKFLSMLTASLAIFAVMGKILFSSFKETHNKIRKRIQSYASAGLIALAALGQQSVLWAFLVFWLINKLLFSFRTLAHEHSPPSKTLRKALLHSVSYFSQLAFSFLAFSQISSNNRVSNLLTIIFWILWWVLCIQYLKSLISKGKINSKKSNYLGNYQNLLIAAVGILAASLETVLLTTVIDWLSLAIKGNSIRILSTTKLTSSTIGLFLISLIPAFILTYSKIERMNEFTKPIKMKFISFYKRIFSRHENINFDPLDQTQRLSVIFISAASFLYRTIEQNSIEKLASLFQKLFSFLFNKIEKLTSVDFWKNTLNAIIKSSRGVQRWHAGLLRLNMFWFLLFIIILALILFNLGIPLRSLTG